MIASNSGNINAAECLLSNSNLAIDQKNNVGGTALSFAAQKNNCPMIKLLLDKGANINKATNHGSTALMIAAIWKNINAVKCLLSYPNLAINQKNNDGLTALDLAIQQPDNQEIIDLIQDAIAEKHAQNKGINQ
jgi:ankyrin repeat protein